MGDDNKKRIKFGEGIKLKDLTIRAIYKESDKTWWKTRLKIGLVNATSFKLQLDNKPYKNYKVTDIRRPLNIRLTKGGSYSLHETLKIRTAAYSMAHRYNRKKLEIVNMFYQVTMVDSQGDEFTINFGSPRQTWADAQQLSEDIEQLLAAMDDYQNWVDSDKDEEYEVN